MGCKRPETSAITSTVKSMRQRIYTGLVLNVLAPFNLTAVIERTVTKFDK